ncbi:polysaccharide deacetylase family protein [Glutamicibacter sp. BSL13]
MTSNHGRVLRAAAMTLTGLLALSGCAVSQSSAPDDVNSLQQLPDTTASSEAEGGNTRLTGLNRVTTSNERLHMYAAHLELKDHPQISRATRESVTASIDAFLADHQDALDEDVTAKPELNINSQAASADQSVLGVSQQIYEFAGASGANSYRTQWFDVQQDREIPTRELFSSSEAWDHVRQMLAEQANSKAGIDLESVTDLPEEATDDVQFTTSGDLQVQVDEYLIAPGSEGTIVLQLDAGRIDGLLSDLGRAAQGSVVEHDAAPTPEPVPGTSESGSATPEEEQQQNTPAQVPEVSQVDCREAKCVALTFDDGPGASTGYLLDSLKKEGVPATFFVVGPNAQARPQLLQRMQAEGHQIGNHTFSHRSLPALASSEVAKELLRTDEAISSATGYSSTLVRPPYGAHNKDVDRIVTSPLILWDVDTLDWKHRNTNKTISTAMDEVRPGSIILMHDIHASTVAAVPGLIRQLKDKGYTPVRVDQLFAHSKLSAGKAYYRGEHPAS